METTSTDVVFMLVKTGWMQENQVETFFQIPSCGHVSFRVKSAMLMGNPLFS